MMHMTRRLLPLALAAGMIALTPAAADAQLGGFIKKKIGDRIADKVLGDDKSSERRTPAPKFDDDILEITAAQLDRLLKGVDAEAEAVRQARAAEAAVKQQGEARKAAYEAERKAYDAKEKEYGKAVEAYTKCQMSVVGRAMKSAVVANPSAMKMAEAMMKLPEAERDAFQERMERKQKEMQAADARKDMVAAQRIRNEIDADMKKTLGVSLDEMQADGAKSGAAIMDMQAEQAKCGSEPVPPVEPVDPSNVEIDVRDSVRVAAVKASGMSEGQYAIMRERVAAWLAKQEKKRAALGLYGFTDGELAILTERHAVLKAREDALLANDSAGGWYF